MNIATPSPGVNEREQAKEPTEGEVSLSVLLAHVRALREEVRRLRDEQSDDLRLLDVDQVSQRLNLSERSIRSYLSDGTIRSLKVGRRRLIPRSALEEFVESRVEAREGGSDE
jgi:excisionase family DNA binding protein